MTQILPMQWKGKGYYAFPDPSDICAEPTDHISGAWLSWLKCLKMAKNGQFAAMDRMLSMCVQEIHPVLDKLIAVLLGDAAPSRCVDQVVDRVSIIDNYEIVLSMCDIMHARGKLSDVRVLIDVFLRISYIKDADIITTYVSDIVEDRYGEFSDHEAFGSVEMYSDAVIRRCEYLKKKFGTDQVLLFKGGVLDVRSVAAKVLDNLSERTFPVYLRRKFEASTGIDCTDFYRNGVFQPLSAGGIIENFLEGLSKGTFEKGSRYFFGHRIP